LEENVAQPPPAVVKDLKGKNTREFLEEGMSLLVPQTVSNQPGFSPCKTLVLWGIDFFSGLFSP
jgi:hypothetical protein